jgi:hypothetical protein
MCGEWRASGTEKGRCGGGGWGAWVDGGGGRGSRSASSLPGTHRGMGALIKGEEESILREMGELLSLENRERSIDINSTERTGSYVLIFWCLY